MTSFGTSYGQHATNPARGHPTRHEARCVLWAKDAPPDALLEAMRRRGVEPVVTHNAFQTMAEIVAEGSLELSGSLVVLVEPSRLRGKKAMLISCRRYAADLRVWVFQAAAPVQLRPLELSQLVPEPEQEVEHTFGADPGAGNEAVQAEAPRRPASGSHALRLVEPDPEESLLPMNDHPRATDNPGVRRPAGLLTDEEIAMLLADDPAERKKR